MFSLLLVFFISYAAAESYSLTAINDTYATVSVTDAVNMYSYDLSLDTSGGPTSYSITRGATVQSGFLGAGGVASYGASWRDYVISVYGSRLDNTGAGVTKSGELFNITHSAPISLRYKIAVSGAGDSDTVYYNSSAERQAREEDAILTQDIAGGGGSGGGGGVTKLTDPIKLTVSPKEIIQDVVVNVPAGVKINVINNANRSISLSLGFQGVGNVVNANRELNLAAYESKDIELTIVSSSGGIYVGKLNIMNAGVVIAEVPITVTVRDEDFALDASINIDGGKQILRGKNLSATTKINNPDSNPVKVELRYTIKNFRGDDFYEEIQEVSLARSDKIKKNFPTEALPYGNYVIGLEVIYPGSFASFSDRFEVVPYLTERTRYVSLLALVIGVVIAGAILVYWAVRRKKKVR